ncbi:MAG TPA: PilZ domain-containing protein [Chitinivibrionales bacterium]|nr:PilZ domain-containing protein [Chitinivibrionales bacterium]
MPHKESMYERRKHARLPIERPPFPVSFRCNGGHLSAFVEDISASGAKLRISEAGDHIPFLVQGEFTYTFHTALGPTQCKARTVWVQRKGVDFFWGVEFIRLDSNDSNPLNVIIKDLNTQAM